MGFDPGPIDGIPGPRTLNATLSAMQRGAAVVKETAPMALIGLGLAVGLGGGVLLARRKRAAA
jgi:LPXTG-motif cell wall-anchored protein